jgi:hypothetical protein
MRDASGTRDGGSGSPRADGGTLVAFLLMVVFAGGNAVAVRFSNSGLPPFWGAGLRFGTAAVGFRITAPLRRTALPREMRWSASWSMVCWPLGEPMLFSTGGFCARRRACRARF